MTEKMFNSTAGESEGRLELLFLMVTIAAISAYLVNQVYDLDVWWHLAIGNDILARHAVPAHDHFARAALGRPYHDSHWLFQVVLACAERLGGMIGVQAVMVGVWALALFYCRKAINRWTASPLNNILLFAVAMASSERFLPRPEIVTFLMVALFYLRLQEGKIRTFPELLLMGVLQAVWANCHGLFVLGPFMAGCYWAVAAYRRFTDGDSGLAHLNRLMMVLLATTLLTPFGLTGWRYALLLVTEVTPAASSVLRGVGELSPTFGRAAMSAPAFWFFATLLVSLAATLPAALLRRVPPERLLIAAGLGAAAVTGRRNMALFALVAAPLLAEYLRLLVPGRSRGGRIATAAAMTAMLVAAWFPLSGRYYLMMQIPSRFGLGVTPSFFPYGLTTFLQRSGFRGQVFNSNTLGGFFLRSFYPKFIPLTDGRWEVYDERVLEALQRSTTDPVLWQGAVTAYDIRGVLLQHASPEARGLVPILTADPGWRLVYYDNAASFWMRGDTPGLPPAIDLSSGAALHPSPSRVDDCLILDMFYQRTGADGLRLRNLERVENFHWQAEKTLEQIGSLQIKLGRMADAERTYQKLSSEFPRNIVALNEMAYFAYQRGDSKGAAYMLERALDIDPDDRNSRENYQRIRARFRP